MAVLAYVGRAVYTNLFLISHQAWFHEDIIISILSTPEWQKYPQKTCMHTGMR